MVDCPTGIRRVERSPKADIGAIILEWGFLSSKHMSIRFRVREALNLRSWAGSCLIGDEPSGGGCPIEDEP